MKWHYRDVQGWLSELTTCHWSSSLTPIVGLHISFPVTLLSEARGRLWGERRLCGAAGRKWTGPFQDDASSWPLLSLPWPRWDVSLIIIYVPIRIISLSKAPNISYTWEGRSHQKSFSFVHGASVRILYVRLHTLWRIASPKYLTVGAKPTK